VAIAALLPTSSLMRREATAASADSFELAIGAPAGAEFQIGSNSGNVILSPDGTRIAFVAATDKARTIWIRSLAVDDARSIPGTENASNLFWSPDGRSIGFFAGVKLRTVSIAGGLPETIADATGGRGGSWSDDGTIIFAPIGGSALFRVAASGGTVAPLTTLDASRGENAHYWPEFLPGGRQFLYFARSTQLDNNGIYLGNMDGSPAVRLIPSLSSGILARHPVSAGWYLMWARDDDLLGQPFDVTTGRLAGDVSTIARGVRVEESQRLLYASASRNGRLVWATSRAAETALSLFGRDGRRISVLDVPPGKLVQPALSPDGSRLLFTRVEQGTADIYLYDFRKKVTERLTTDPDYDESPVWTSDGLAMMYMGRDRSERVVFRLAIGSGGRPVKVQSEGAYSPGIETPDRRYAIVSAPNPKTGRDVAALSPASAGTLVPLLQDPGDQQPLALSVDGRALFVGLVSGSRNAVGVGRLYLDRPTPTLGPIQMVAEDAQAIAVRPDGREAFVLAPDGFIKAIALTPGNDNVAIGATTSLFPAPPGTGGFSVNPTGTQFVVAEAPFVMGQTIRVLTRWDARLGK
jgi:Tol biopolymer transport system component